jgi:hypothetical protein
LKGVYGARRPDVINGSAKLIIFSARKLATGLAKAFAACKKHEAKLIVANLNPPSRNITLVDKLLESKIKFIAVDMPFADKHTTDVDFF